MRKSNFLIVLCLSLIAVFLSFKSDIDSDLYWHMATGRWIWENLSFPSEDTFSFIYNGVQWIDLPWIFQTSSFFMNEWFGYSGVLVLCALSSVISIILIWKTICLCFEKLSHDDQSNLAHIMAFVVLTLLCFYLEKRWVVRPEIFTTVFLSLVMYILVSFCTDQNKQRMLWILPIIQVAWVNSHGMFILGPVLIGVVWFQNPKKLTLPLIASILACFVNPYFHEGAFYPFYLRSISSDPIYRIIGEGQALWDDSISFHHRAMWAIWIALLGFSFKSGLRVLKRSYYLWLIFALYFSTTMMRNLAPAVLLTAPFIVIGVSEFLAKISSRILVLKKKAVAPVVLVWTVSMCGVISLNGFEVVRKNFHFGFSISPDQDLESAASFFTEHKIQERIFATPEFSNYMLWKDPAYKSYIDTRYAEVVPKEHFKRLFQLVYNPIELDYELNRQNIKTIALNHTHSNYYRAVQYFNRSSNWKRVYFDHFIVVFIKINERNDLPFLSDESIKSAIVREIKSFNAMKTHSTSDYLFLYQLLVGASNLGLERFIADSLGTISDLDHRQLANLFCSFSTFNYVDGSSSGETGLAEKALNACHFAFEKSKEDSAAFNLGMIYLRLKKFDESIEYLNLAIQKRANVANYYFALAEAMSAAKINDQSRIEQNYSKATELDPFNALHWIRLAHAYESRGNNAAAIETIEKSLRFIPNDNSLKSYLEKIKSKN